MLHLLLLLLFPAANALLLPLFDHTAAPAATPTISSQHNSASAAGQINAQWFSVLEQTHVFPRAVLLIADSSADADAAEMERKARAQAIIAAKLAKANVKSSTGGDVVELNPFSNIGKTPSEDTPKVDFVALDSKKLSKAQASQQKIMKAQKRAADAQAAARAAAAEADKAQRASAGPPTLSTVLGF